MFENSVDQARQFVGPDLDTDCLVLWSYFLNNALNKICLKYNQYATKTHEKFQACKEK